MGSIDTRIRDPIGAALFGATRQAVLRLFFGHADQRFYQRQAVRLIGLGSGTVQRDLERLTRAGILTRTVDGRQTYYQANRDCAVFEELHGIVRKTFGVADVLHSALGAGAERIRLAFLYGSVAVGSETAASDVDVMIVGDKISLDEVVSLLAETQTELRREVNPTVYRVDEFCRKLAEGHHFLSSVVAGPKIFLVGNEGELRRLAKGWMAQGAPRQPARNRRPPGGRRSRHSGI